MRVLNLKSLFVSLFSIFTLIIGTTACVSDDQQQFEDEFVQEETLGGEPTEFTGEGDSLEAVTDEQPIELVSPLAAEDIGMPLEDTTAPVEPVANSLDIAAAEEAAKIAGDMAAAQTPEVVEVRYTILRGDWLSKIALRVYGDMTKWHLITGANPDIQNPNLIFAGHSIVIPVVDEASRTFAESYAGHMPQPTQQKWDGTPPAGLDTAGAETLTTDGLPATAMPVGTGIDAPMSAEPPPVAQGDTEPHHHQMIDDVDGVVQ